MDDFFGVLALLGPWTAYTIVFVSALAENVFPPFPSDLVIILGACLAGMGDLNVAAVWIAAVVGGYTGFMSVFAVARWKGRPFFSSGRWEPHMRRASRWFDRYGEKLIVISRFLPGIRAVVSALAGVSGMHPQRVALYSLAATVLWYSALVALGSTVGADWQRATHVVRTYDRVLLAILVVSAMVVGVVLLVRRRAAKGAARTELD